MAMYKAADFPQHEELVISLPFHAENTAPEDDIVILDQLADEEQVVEMQAPQEDELCFKLPHLPGANDNEVELAQEVELSGEEKKKEEDKSKVSDQPKDLNWLKSHLDKIPKHRGETLGCERALAYLERTENMLRKMLQEDHDGNIDISKAEDARIVIEDGVERLKKELQKRKKKVAANQESMKKEAGIPGMMITVPVFISRLARVCINSTISGGKDIEHTFSKLADKWKLTDREQAELIQVIQDMGYPLPRLDRGFMVDDKEPYSYSSENNFDMPPNYQA